MNNTISHPILPHHSLVASWSGTTFSEDHPIRLTTGKTMDRDDRLEQSKVVTPFYYSNRGEYWGTVTFPGDYPFAPPAIKVRHALCLPLH